MSKDFMQFKLYLAKCTLPSIEFGEFTDPNKVSKERMIALRHRLEREFVSFFFHLRSDYGLVFKELVFIKHNDSSSNI